MNSVKPTVLFSQKLNLPHLPRCRFKASLTYHFFSPFNPDCPECLKNSWAYPKMARENPFYAQVWDPQHSPDETYEIPMKYSAFEIMQELKKKLAV